ncbi:ABC transporter substrate-binding protein [Paenibacillus sacheonensis]|nr:ABC transporter substrate-binding protein [Paenibacillus sacheonensis]MBM7566026.1 NitT/TauT family transport system substrate-binding protein [Paenibacillus sacheonensis]
MKSAKGTVYFSKRNAAMAVCLVTAMAALSACGSNEASNDGNNAAASNANAGTDAGNNAAANAGTGTEGTTTNAGTDTAVKDPVKATLILNWFAEPEHGGNFAALAKGFYKDAGFDMTLMPGGPSVSATQLVASGKAEFGMANGDDILVARQEGIPVVAIATAFQKSPQALFYHKDSGISDFGDLNDHKVYVAATANFWQYMKKKFSLDKAQEMKYTGQLVNFINDKNAVTQGYVTSETYTLQQEGIDFDVLLNADSGYNIYAGVYFTTEKMIKEHPDQVKAFVEATVKGWDYYKTNSDEINPAIQEKNPEMTLDMMKFSAEKEMDFAFGGDAATMGTGVMTTERWTEVQQQLKDVGVLTKDEDIGKAFTTEFLPKK